MSETRFSGRAVLVTGGGSGIGRVMAMRFAAEGAAVVVVDIVGEKAEEVVREIVEAGGKAIAVRADVSVAADVAAMVAAGLWRMRAACCAYSMMESRRSF